MAKKLRKAPAFEKPATPNDSDGRMGPPAEMNAPLPTVARLEDGADRTLARNAPPSPTVRTFDLARDAGSTFEEWFQSSARPTVPAVPKVTRVEPNGGGPRAA